MKKQGEVKNNKNKIYTGKTYGNRYVKHAYNTTTRKFLVKLSFDMQRWKMSNVISSFTHSELRWSIIEDNRKIIIIYNLSA